jgi:hypothetical protein
VTRQNGTVKGNTRTRESGSAMTRAALPHACIGKQVTVGITSLAQRPLDVLYEGTIARPLSTLRHFSSRVPIAARKSSDNRVQSTFAAEDQLSEIAIGPLPNITYLSHSSVQGLRLAGEHFHDCTFSLLYVAGAPFGFRRAFLR